jgi:hypothetical protein
MIKTKIIFSVFVLLCFCCPAQLAKVSIAEPQKSTFKTLGNGLNLRASETDDFYSIPFHQMVESKDNYFKVGITANYGYFKTSNLFIHVIQLSKALIIEKEFEIELESENKEGKVRPIKIFTVGNKIELLAINVDKANAQFNIYNWEFNLSDFSVLVKNRKLASFPYSKSSKYEHIVDINKTTQSFALCVAERKGKKSTDCAMHVVSCNNATNTLFKQSADFSMKYAQEMVIKMQVSGSGATWALIAENDKKGEINNQIICATKEKINIFPLQQNGNAIVNAGIAVNKANGIYIAGLLNTGDKGFATMVFTEMDITGKMAALTNVDLKKELAGTNENGSEDGLNKDNRVQQIIVRDNGLVDVFTIDHTSKEVTSGRTAFPWDTKSEFGDINLFSFKNNKLTNLKTIRRNITEKQTSSFFNYDLRAYSLPVAFSRNNELYFLYLANTSNADGANNDLKVKKETTSECLFVVAKMDENFKIKSQPLFDYTERNGNFDMYASITLCGISDTKYFAYHETEFGLYTKAKLDFAIMELK